MLLFECEVEPCKEIIDSGSFCRNHRNMNDRHGTPIPVFTCRACADPYVFLGRSLGSSDWYCPSCYVWYKKIRKRSGNRESGGSYFSQHGIGLSQYIELYVAHDGKCKICGFQPESNRDLHIDHDHNCCAIRTMACGQCIRGLLCRSCNIMLGQYQNQTGYLTIDVFDKYLAQGYFIFTSPQSGKLVRTVKYRDPGSLGQLRKVTNQ